MNSSVITDIAEGANLLKMVYAVSAVVTTGIVAFISVTKAFALVIYSALDKTLMKYIRLLLI